MKFSQLDVIGQEREAVAARKEAAGLIDKLFNAVLYPKNPNRTFKFYVPNYLYLRSVTFCEDVEEDIGKPFGPNDLAQVLYIDFLHYIKKTNDLHDLFKRLTARDIAPPVIAPYNTDAAYNGVIFDEVRGFEEVAAGLAHKEALRGEYLLRDLLEVYQDHNFTLEHILQIVFCDFVDDYRKGIIKNPIGKITNYL